MTKQYDILVKLMILGDSGVGKTCLLRRFTEKEYHPYHISTIGKFSAIIDVYISLTSKKMTNIWVLQTTT